MPDPQPTTQSQPEADPAAVKATALGAVFTRRWIVELVLDLAGYTSDVDLAARVAIEPACGHGAFITVMVERLVESCRTSDRDLESTADALIGMDIDPSAVRQCRALVRKTMESMDVPPETATRLARTWIRSGDFLRTARTLPRADWILGNPPYVRIEDMAEDDVQTYRASWPTMSGRADLYVGFYEAGLQQLEPGGRLGFICADRWMRNRYGSGLRRLVEESYSLDACIVMHDVDAFEDKVAAYPAITVLRRGTHDASLMVEAEPEFDQVAAQRVTKTFERGRTPVVVDASYRASWLTHRPTAGESWPAGTPEQLALLADLEARFPALEDTGARVSVGVATGAEDVYVISDPALVEPSRRIRTLSAKETTHGGIDWRKRYLVNPWDEDGLVSLDDYPLLAAYMQAHRARLEQRHVAQKSPHVWWRTIDRINPAMAQKPKLLIPDLKERIHPVLDQGEYIPLHNTYYLTSDTWELPVLGGLLLSQVANMFVEAYSVRMANGYLRVSAQYLRRVRVPHPDTISPAHRTELRAAFWTRDIPRATSVARDVYGIGGCPTS